MSDASEVKRWEPCLKDSPAGTYVTARETRRVRDVFVKVEDHDRIVADLKAEIVRLSRPVSAVCTKCGYDKPANLYEQTIATQARVIDKLKGMVSHYETCATVDRYDDEEVPCDCGLEKELAAIEKEGAKNE